MEEFWKFVDEYRGVAPHTLRLRFHGDSRQWVGAAISHIEAMPKGLNKYPHLPERWMFPSVLSVEQGTPPGTSALNRRITLDALARHREGDASHGMGGSSEIRMLDMTAGLGMDALRFAESGARMKLFEMNPAHADALKINFSSFPNIEVVEGDSVEWLRNNPEELFDIIFIDPARRDSAGSRVYNLHDCTPDVTELLPLFEGRCSVLVAKLSPMLDITQTLRDIPGCSEIHVVEEGGECRELFAVVPFPYSDRATRIVAHRQGWEYSFKAGCADEAGSTVPYSDPAPGDYLVELSPALMKAAPYARLCSDFDMGMIAPNSRLFIAHRPVMAPIGSCLRIKEVIDFSSGKLKKIGRAIGAAEVVARNLPGINSEQLRARLGIGESASRRLVGTSMRGGRKVLLLLDKEI